MSPAVLTLAQIRNVDLGVPKVTPPFYTPLQRPYGSLAGTRTKREEMPELFGWNQLS